jgi:putative spermidine/putrescine transport system ATP-binding protein
MAGNRSLGRDMAYLELTGMRKRFGRVQAVDGVDISLEDGRLLSLLGPSGCGKTTLLRIIAGLERPDSGEVWIAGERVTELPANRRGIGMVFQSYALFPNMTAASNIAYGLQLRKWSAQKIRDRVAEMVDLTQLGDAAERFPHQLSGGQQQRVALARALAIQPRVLLLDEPLSALDATVRVTLRQGIRRIQQELGISAVYVTHDQEEALSISDDVVVMQSGRVEQAGAPEELYANPATEFVAAFVGAANRLPATIVDPAAGTARWGSTIFQATRTDNRRAGDAVTIVVRPERVAVRRVDPDNQSGDGPIGEVVQRTFLGSNYRLTVETEAGPVVAEVTGEGGLLQRGDHVHLHFEPGSLIALDRSNVGLESAV